MLHNEIFEKLKLTTVECSSDVKLPDLKFVTEILRSELKTLGMSPPKSKITQDFKNRGRVPNHDLLYSLENLRERQGDILGLYCHNYREPEVILYVDSCLRAAKDISVLTADLIEIVLIHELAHHAIASAVVKDRYKKVFSWEDYDKCNDDAWPSVHEYFAQSLAFVCVAEHHDGSLNALWSLSKHQSSIYRTWEILGALTQNNVLLPFIRDSLKAQFLALMKADRKHCRSVIEIENMHEMSGFDE